MFLYWDWELRLGITYAATCWNSYENPALWHLKCISTLAFFAIQIVSLCIKQILFFLELINICNLKEFGLQDMLDYIAYSGNAAGLVDLLGSSKVLKDFIFKFIRSHKLILQQSIYFARKFKKPASLRLLRQIQAHFKRGANYDLKNIVIKMRICGGNLSLFSVCASDPKRPCNIDSNGLNPNLPPYSVKTCKKLSWS